MFVVNPEPEEEILAILPGHILSLELGEPRYCLIGQLLKFALNDLFYETNTLVIPTSGTFFRFPRVYLRYFLFFAEG